MRTSETIFLFAVRIFENLVGRKIFDFVSNFGFNRDGN